MLCLSFTPVQDNISQAPETASVLDLTKIVARFLFCTRCRRCTGGKPRRACSQEKALPRSAMTARPAQ